MEPVQGECPNCVHTKQQSCKIYEAKADRTEKIEKSTIIVKTLTALSTIDGPTRQKIIQHIEKLKNIINQGDLINVYRTCYAITKEYLVFSTAHGTFTKISWTTKQSLKNLKSHRVFSHHNGIKLEINNRKIPGKPPYLEIKL